MKICVVNLLRTKRNAGTLESDNKKQYNNIQLRKDIQAEQPTASSYPTSWENQINSFLWSDEINVHIHEIQDNQRWNEPRLARQSPFNKQLYRTLTAVVFSVLYCFALFFVPLHILTNVNIFIYC